MYNNYYALILAGGTGTRLYPRSRNEKPKQFQSIIGKKTLVEQTFDRVITLVENQNIYISTNKSYIDTTKIFLPSIADENYIGEPIKRNTAPAIALAAALISRKNKDAIIASIHSDHIVRKIDNYSKVFKAAYKAILQDPSTIITIGIQPNSAHTGYGYIERENSHTDVDDVMLYKAKRFVEKPDIKTAQEYLKKGTYYWNAGYFIFKATHILDEIKKYLPDVYKGVIKISDNTSNPDYQKIMRDEFAKFPNVPIDTAIMEKTYNFKVIPADLGWSDVGSWDSVADLIDGDNLDENGNYFEGLTVSVDTYNSVVLSHDDSKAIATIGLDNIIVVTTDDAILITQKGRSEEVKKVVEELKERKKEYLL